MPISRMQQPRQLYGLGSFVKSVGKAVKGVGKAVKNVAKSDLGKAALTAAALYYGGRMIPGIGGGQGGIGSFFGKGSFNPLKMLATVGPQTGQLVSSPFGRFLGTNLGKASIIGGVSALGGMFTAKEQEDIEELRESGDPEKLKNYLRRYYTNLNPDADTETVESFVRANAAYGGRMKYANGSDENKESEASKRVKELMDDGYTFGEAVKQAMKEGYAQGGRIDYNKGTNNPFLKMIDKVAPKEDPLQKLADKISPLFIDKDGDYRKGLQKAKFALSKFIAGKGTDLDTGAEWYSKLDDDIQKEIIMEKIKYRNRGQLGGTPLYDEKFAGRYGIGGNYAQGGRIEENVDQASGIMGLPQRTNAAGVKELDLRKSGGFIPPVGVKEKADDIPAMLSNNEFVFTADAVRGMGDGDVNMGAQRMYNMMKKLEKEGRVV